MRRWRLVAGVPAVDALALVAIFAVALGSHLVNVAVPNERAARTPSATPSAMSSDTPPTSATMPATTPTTGPASDTPTPQATLAPAPTATPAHQPLRFASFPITGAAQSMVLGPDGAMWMAEPTVHTIGRITTSGAYTPFTLPVGSDPSWLVVGPDGNLWFTEPNGQKIGQIGRITPSGQVTEFPLPAPPPPLAGWGPSVIIVGPDGNLWFCEGYSYIGRITPSGQVTQFWLQGAAAALQLIAGGDGNVWFASLNSYIGKLTVTGQVTTYPTSAPINRDRYVGASTSWGIPADSWAQTCRGGPSCQDRGEAREIGVADAGFMGQCNAGTRRRTSCFAVLALVVSEVPHQV